MGELRYAIWIDAPPTAVWRAFTDLDLLPAWQTGAPVVAERSGPGDVAGTRYTVRRGPLRSDTHVVTADAPVRYESETAALLGLRIHLRADVAVDGTGTRLALVARTTWPRGLRLLGRLVEAAVLSPREAERELANLKALVERGDRGDPAG